MRLWQNATTPHDLLRNPFPNGFLLPPGRAPGEPD
jgi:hypothetical protein